MEEGRWRRNMHLGFWWGNLKERNPLEELDARTVLKEIQKETGWGTRIIRLRMRTREGSCDHSTED